LSSSRWADSFAVLVRRSLVVLRQEHPVAYQALCSQLAGELLLVVVEDEEIRLAFTRDAVREVEALAASPTTEFRTDRRTLIDILEGRSSLLEAVLGDRVYLLGAPRSLWRFHEGLVSYLQGAVRCPSFPPLLAALKGKRPASENTTDTNRRTQNSLDQTRAT
jgi:hypothetical protein